MDEAVVIAGERDVEGLLATLAREKRMVFLAGLPGVGKSLFVRALALAAHRIGRPVHLLQWDVVRPAFVSRALDARYPEQGGQAHAMIRKAVGAWARRAVLRWDREHDAAHCLIGEVPLVGGRLLDLVQAQADEAELLLAGLGALFVVPAPSVAVRGLIEGRRGRTFADPTHPRERADAPPDVLQRLWQEVHALAVAIGAASSCSGGLAPFDPQAYVAVYRHLLRHRRTLTLWVEAQLDPRGSVYDLGFATRELVPTEDEATDVVADLERHHSVDEIERSMAEWFTRA